MVNVSDKQIVKLDSPLPVVGELSKEQKTLYSILNEEPDPSKLLINKYAKNSKYLPISHIEALMDSTFGPTNWKVSEPKIQIIGASAEKQGQAYATCTVVVSIINTQFDSPVWIERGGACSDYVEHKKMKTFAAAMKSEAFKNACKSLGKVFGRDLNRNHQETITEGIRTQSEMDDMQTCQNKEELRAVYGRLSKADQMKYKTMYVELAEKLPNKKENAKSK